MALSQVQLKQHRPWAMLFYFFISLLIFAFPAYVPEWVAPLSATSLRAGQIWTTLTYALLHQGWQHFLLNFSFFLILMRVLQPVLTQGEAAALMIVSALGGAVGSLAALAIDPRLPATMLCVGASGVVMGLNGFVLALLQWRARVKMLVLFIPIPGFVWLLYLLLVIWAGVEVGWLYRSVAYGAHLGGFVAGWCFARCARRWFGLRVEAQS